MREQLGDVPVAVLEKGKQPGSHLLSGAVMNPRAIRKLFAGRITIEEMPTYGKVHGEAVYLLTKGAALRIPPPPTMMNHGNWIVSRLRARPVPRRAGGGRRRDDPARDGRREAAPRARPRRRRAHRRQGPRQGGRAARRTSSRAPTSPRGSRCSPRARRATSRLPRSTTSGSRARNPQIWALGVKEVWRVREAAASGSSTRWAGRSASARSTASSAARAIYPMGEEHVSLGFVVGLEYADVELSAHDVLQEFKTHRLVRKILDGGERVAWGAKTITEGGLHSLPSRLNAPGLRARRRERRARQRAAAEGRPLRDRVRAAGRRGERSRRSSAARWSGAAARSTRYDEALRASYIWKELDEVRNMRQVFDKGFFMGGALASAMTVTKGKLPPKDFETQPNADATRSSAPGARPRYPAPDGKLTLRQALLGLRLGQPHARRPAEPRARSRRRCRATWPRCGSGCARRRCTRSGEADGDGTVEVR